LSGLQQNGLEPRARPLVLLWGFMGAGKSTVGRALAARTGADFVDLDEQLELEGGISIAELFARHGEADFRARERRALEALLSGQGRRVVALGGGALLDEELRKRALSEGFVVVLAAPLATLQGRMRTSSERPLSGQAARLYKERASAYAEAHSTIDTSARTVAEVVEALLNAWSASPN
jgi:shikimate kinase